MQVSNSSPIGNPILGWGDSSPPEFIKLYEITTPLEKFIGIGHVQMLGVLPLFYWINPDEALVPRYDGYTMRIYPYSQKEELERRLQPAVVTIQKVYLPRFHENEWRKSNKISLASI